MKFHNREAIQIENERMRLTVLKEGGHIAEILHKDTGISPLWIPPWPSMEPSHYDPKLHPEYGLNGESKLLAGIMGHNLCLDLFGPPSAEEESAGATVHGESSVLPYSIEHDGQKLHASATLPLSALNFVREVELDADGSTIHITETVENLTALDRPIGWTQHVTLGPPFLQSGVTHFAIPAVRSRVFEDQFGETALLNGADFSWPLAPTRRNTAIDLSRFSSEPKSAGFTAHLMDPALPTSFFAAYLPTAQLLFGGRWKQQDFPWLGLWEENHSRQTPPWNGQTVALGLEFGVSPFPETRRQMISRGSLFDVPAYRWLPAGSSVSAAYSFILRQTKTFDLQNPAL
jgi:hypothetical protein